MIFRPFPLLSLFSIAGLVILILLGNWQYARYSEKLGRAPEAASIFSDVVVDVDQAPSSVMSCSRFGESAPGNTSASV